MLELATLAFIFITGLILAFCDDIILTIKKRIAPPVEVSAIYKKAIDLMYLIRAENSNLLLEERLSILNELDLTLKEIKRHESLNNNVHYVNFHEKNKKSG